MEGGVAWDRAFAFDRAFEALAGFSPMPWQERLFSLAADGRFPDACDIPTGLGKTSVIAIWLLALVYRAQIGR